MQRGHLTANYLTDEAVDVSKGAKAVVSILHFWLGEDIHLLADCGGQNMVGYLLWRVLTRNITLSFMVAGHTKFSPDWCFDLLEK